MKNIFAISALFAAATVSAQAQGTIKFNNSSTTKISTNSVVGGAATGAAGGFGSPIYRYALLYSTTAASVNGMTDAIVGGVSTNYAFTDTNWILVAYGTNFGTGQFVSASASASGATAVSGVAGGSSAQFVVIGWSVDNCTNLSTLQGWFHDGSPPFNGWIGQSAVSGSITLGTTTAATLFGTSAPDISGFTLGLVVPPASVPPYITVQPNSVTAAVGDNASFSVSAYGTPTPICQWMLNSSNIIAGATNFTLTIPDVQLTNAGSYSLFITNSAGSTNSFAAALNVTQPTGPGYLIFGNNNTSATKICTNSSVGGPATGLTAGVGGAYFFALYASSNVANVNGQTVPIVGNASSNYAFSDANWMLVGYGTNIGRGLFFNSSASASGEPTSIPGFAAGATGQFVVIGWSGNIGTNITAVQSWFNGGSPASDGWIGQSAVSGTIELAAIVHAPWLFGTTAPYLQGFTLGLASPNAGATYPVPYAPPALIQAQLNANCLQLSWPTAAGSFGIQSASSPAGPWSDTTLTNGVIVPLAAQTIYYRLVAE